MPQLYKSKNKFLFGVCSGLAKYLGLNVSIVRVAVLLGAIFTGSIIFWLYILLAIILPNEE
jgi:phage shock protein C